MPVGPHQVVVDDKKRVDEEQVGPDGVASVAAKRRPAPPAHLPETGLVAAAHLHVHETVARQ